MYLKLWPVHGHARPVGAAPPAQVLLVTGCLDTLMQVSMELVEPVARGTTLKLGNPGCPQHPQAHSAQPEHRGDGRVPALLQISMPTLRATPLTAGEVEVLV